MKVPVRGRYIRPMGLEPGRMPDLPDGTPLQRIF